MQQIHWGILGCGDVTEWKSGPAFNKVPNSKLVAVMRRDAAKAEDYARRHGVPRWYNDAAELIQDPGVNALYIATPPSSHKQYALAALQAGKPVYLEKPMTLNYEEAFEIDRFATEKNIKLVVAHYRREQPYFKKIKALLDEKAIGEPRLARLSFFDAPLSAEALKTSKTSWRVDPAISGGGLFHDLAPHQLDLACYFLGEPASVQGISISQSYLYAADDLVSGNILFKNGIVFTGTWCFNVSAFETKDEFEIIGSEGSIRFSVFGKQQITLNKNGNIETLFFEAPTHVQQPMIEAVVNYFTGRGENPCTALQGVTVMRIMDKMTETSS